MKSIRFLLVFFIVQTLLPAQNPSEDHLGSWYTYSGHHRLSERISLSPGLQFRYYETSSNYNLGLFYIGGNYHINSTSTIALGYAFLDIDTVFEFDHQPNIKEHRTYEYYTYKHKIKAFNIQHRFRQEQRFLSFSDRNEVQHRFRYRISASYPIHKIVSLRLSEEPFINFQDQVFHENRFYIGLSITLLKHSQLQVGYLKQHIRKNNLNRIQIGINIKTDSRTPKTTVSLL